MKKLPLTTILLIALFTTPARAAEEAASAAVFNNDRISAADLQLPEALAAKQQADLSPIKFQQFEYTFRMETLARWIHSKLKRRLLEEYHYQVTELEVNAYLQQARLLRSRMSEAELTQVRGRIADWHFDSILYGRFGGTAVRVSTGRIKPIEAYYAYVEELMAKQVLFFPNIEYRAALKILSVYFERDQHPEVHELEALKYFVQPSWGPFNERYNALPTKEKYRIFLELKRLRIIQKAR